MVAARVKWAVMLGLSSLILAGAGSAASSLESPLPYTFMALGDSFASGEGNPPYGASPKCHASFSSWPFVVGEIRDYDGYGNWACSGARIRDLFRPFKSFVQVDFLREHTVDMVSITVGGNDVGFGRVLGSCFFRDCIRNGRLDRTRIAIRQLKPRLVRAFKLVRAAEPQARFLIVGYPRLFPSRQSETVNCGWLSALERSELNTMAAELDRAERLAAREAGMEYISMLNVFDGHELCSRDSWVHPVGRAPVHANGHPTVKGHLALAKEFISQVS